MVNFRNTAFNLVLLTLYVVVCSSPNQEHVLLYPPSFFSSPFDSTTQTYPDFQNISWVMKVKDGHKVEITFLWFDLEESFEEGKGPCVYDYVEIKEEDESLHKFCGNYSTFPMDAPKAGEKFYSTGSTLTLKFVSDYSNEAPKPRGFSALFKEVDRDECQEMKINLKAVYDDWDKFVYCNHNCHNVPGSYYCSCDSGFALHSNRHTCVLKCSGDIFTKSSGIISSSNYPEKYSKLANCEWVIQGKRLDVIEIKFIMTFNIEVHEDEGCVFDWIQYETADGVKSKRLCGSTVPNNGNWIQTNSHRLKIQFESDFSVEKGGFALQYRIIPFTKTTGCNPPPIPLHGSIVGETVDPKYKPGSRVLITCKRGYRLVGSNKFTCLTTGKWSFGGSRCQKKTCSSPTHLHYIKNGRIKDLVVSMDPGSIVTVWCYEWYTMTSGVSQWRCGDDGKWHEHSLPVATNKNRNIPVCEPICGLRGNKRILSANFTFGDKIPEGNDPLFSTHIILGKEAKQGEWPWVVFIDRTGNGLDSREYFCGGNLVTQRTVVTAAHCVVGIILKRAMIYVGVHNRSLGLHEKQSPWIQVYQLSKIHIHQKFSFHDMANDIAVVILNDTVKFGQYVRPICLPRSSFAQNLPTSKSKYNLPNTGFVVGWGVTDVLTDSVSNTLQEVRLPLIDQKICAREFNNSRPRLYNHINIVEGMMCAGSITGGRDSCSGDSGGPYMFKNPNKNQWYLNGIVSFGSRATCGIKTFGIYTDVSKYLKWLDEYIKY